MPWQTMEAATCTFFHTAYHGHMALCKLNDEIFMLFDCGASKRGAADKIATDLLSRSRMLNSALDTCATRCLGKTVIILISHGDEDHFNQVWSFLIKLNFRNSNASLHSSVYLLLGGKWCHYFTQDNGKFAPQKSACLHNMLVQKDYLRFTNIEVKWDAFTELPDSLQLERTDLCTNIWETLSLCDRVTLFNNFRWPWRDRDEYDDGVSRNSSSVVAIVKCIDESRILLSGDATDMTWRIVEATQSKLQVHIVLLSHHGSGKHGEEYFLKLLDFSFFNPIFIAQGSIHQTHKHPNWIIGAIGQRAIVPTALLNQHITNTGWFDKHAHPEDGEWIGGLPWCRAMLPTCAVGTISLMRQQDGFAIHVSHYKWGQPPQPVMLYADSDVLPLLFEEFLAWTLDDSDETT